MFIVYGNDNRLSCYIDEWVEFVETRESYHFVNSLLFGVYLVYNRCGRVMVKRHVLNLKKRFLRKEGLFSELVKIGLNYLQLKNRKKEGKPCLLWF